MSEWVRVTSLAALREEKQQIVDVADKAVALFYVADRVYAIDNVCPHAGFPLGDGDLDGEWVICPGHSFYYSLKTGECQNDPGKSATCFEVSVDGDDVKLKL